MARDFLRERGMQLLRDATPASNQAVAEIEPLLEEYGLMTQGMALAELTGRWLMQWPPHMRDELLRISVEASLLHTAQRDG